MVIFFVFAGVVLIGIIVALKLLFSESKEDDAVPLSSTKDEPVIKKVIAPTVSAPPSNKPPSPLQGIFDKIKLMFKKQPHGQAAASRSALSLKDFMEKNKGKDADLHKDEPIFGKLATEDEAIGTLAIKTSPPTEQPLKQLSKEEEKRIEKEIEVSTQLDELKEKYERLDRLFKDKSDEFIKTQSSLDNELRNRKEFNKVKDILEKEISDIKEKLRKAQVEASSAKTESDSYKKRINVLEEKTTRLEKEIISKEHEIDNLVKRLQTFASSTTAHKPPVREAEKEIQVPEISVPETVLAPKPEINIKEEPPPEIPSVSDVNLTPPPVAQSATVEEPNKALPEKPDLVNLANEKETLPIVAQETLLDVKESQAPSAETPQSNENISLKPDILETEVPGSNSAVPAPDKEINKNEEKSEVVKPPEEGPEKPAAPPST